MEQDQQATPPSGAESPGTFLRWHRLRLGLSQEALAETIGASARSIRRWEQNRALPQGFFRERLGQLFGIDPLHLLTSPITEQPPLSPSPLSALTPGLPTPSHQQSMPLLESKFHPPRLPSHLVERERLLTLLDTILDQPLTLLCASAGWGKTTLLSAWAARSPQRVAWVSLNELDNDATRFWGLVIAAMRTYLPAPGETALTLLHSSQPPAITTILIALVQEIEATAPDTQLILIVDDYQVIEDPAIHEAVLFLLEHLPTSLHLAISSRVDSALPLSRWRLRRQVLELHEAELRFTTKESTRFLREAMKVPLEQEAIRLLQERTEGWIAGLQLAVLALREQRDPSAFVAAFRGSHRLLLDYMQEEILERLPPRIQSFLLQTAVLTQMNAAMCQAVTTEEESQQLLEVLERTHLFIVALDDERHWYRFHSLFREGLLARLHASQPELVPQVHRRAARWYEKQGDVHEAMSHALAAADYAFAASLLEQSAGQLWMRGEGKAVQSWIKQFPDHVLRSHAQMALTAALHLLFQTYYAPPVQHAEALIQVEETIARVEYLLKSKEGSTVLPATGEAENEAEERLLRQRTRQLRGLSMVREAYLQGDRAQLQLIIQHMQQEIPEEDMTWKIISTFTLIVHYALHGDTTTLLPSVLEIKQRAYLVANRFALIRAMIWASVVYLNIGHLQLAYQESLQTLELLKQKGEQTPAAGYLYLIQATLRWQWNQPQKARAYLHFLIQHARTWQNMDLLMSGYCRGMQILLSIGDIAAAEQMLEEAEQLARRSGLVLRIPKVKAARVHLWLAQGNLAAAEAWAANPGFTLDTLEYIHDYEYIMLVHVYLAQQRYTEALQVLELLLPWAERSQRGYNVVSLLALQVVIQFAAGAIALSRDTAMRLLLLTESEGYFSVYLDAGEPMHQVLKMLLQELHDQEHTPLSGPPVAISYVTQLLAAFAGERCKC